MGWNKLAGKESWEKTCPQRGCELLWEDTGTDALQSSDGRGRPWGTRVGLTSRGLPGWSLLSQRLVLLSFCLQVKCIVLQVLKGLQYLHENYIIHRWEQQDGRGGKGDGGEKGLTGGSLLILEPWCDSSPPTPVSLQARSTVWSSCGQIGGSVRVQWRGREAAE